MILSFASDSKTYYGLILADKEFWYHYGRDVRAARIRFDRLMCRDMIIFRYRHEYEVLDHDQHGTQREWHDNGMLCEEINWKDDKMHGWRREWDDQGNLIVERYYINGEKV